MKDRIVKINGVDCIMEFDFYKNNRPALSLIDASDGYPYAMATVNIADVMLTDNKEVCIKNYGENEGIMESLMEAEIISAPVRKLQSGFATIYVCEIIDTNWLEFIDNDTKRGNNDGR